MVVLLASVGAWAQSQDSTNDAPTLRYEYDRPELRLTDASAVPRSDSVVVGKNLRLEGPLVVPFKGTARGFPGRLLGLINPFAKSSHPATPTEFRPVDSRAWTSIVGWNPGRSAWADDTHHEPKLGLLTIGSGK
jgi:hypothetical protein